jgi:AraC-like DNA-binding protein
MGMRPANASPNRTGTEATIPPSAVFETWRDSFARKVMKIDVNTAVPADFQADVHARLLPRLFVASFNTGPLSLIRTRDLVRDGSDGCTLTICAEGEVAAQFGGRELRLGPGEAALIPHHHHGSISTRSYARSISLRFDREDARIFAPAADDLVLRAGVNRSAITLTSLYCTQLLSDAGASAPLALTMASHLRELAAHVLNPRSDLARSARYGGVRAARLEAVQRFVAANLREPWLRAETVGQHLGVTGRYVQQLMDGAGLSFTRHVRDLRLDEARRVLQSERGRVLRITDVAYGCGFADLSYFNREFRRRFGETPSGVRRKA